MPVSSRGRPRYLSCLIPKGADLRNFSASTNDASLGGNIQLSGTDKCEDGCNVKESKSNVTSNSGDSDPEYNNMGIGNDRTKNWVQ